MRNFVSPKIAAVGGRLLEYNKNNIGDKWRAEHLKHHWGSAKKINPVFLSGSNVVIRKDILSQVGFYDDKKFKKNYEDVDLSLRLKEKGFELAYEPNATAKHKRKDTLLSALKSYWRWQLH